MKYRINFRNHLSALSGTIIFTILLFLAVWLIGINEGYDIDLFFFFAIFYLVNISLVCFLHFQYNKVNKHTSIIIEHEERQFIYVTKTSKKSIYFHEIQKIEIHMMPSVYRGSNFQFLPFEQYHYAVIYTTNEKIIITCLAMKNLMKVFSALNLKINRIKRIFPNIR